MNNNAIAAFSSEHVMRITGLTARQLSYWDATRFFSPEFETVGSGKSAIRIYSFKDLVSLRTLYVLKKVHKISLQYLRDVASKLSKYSDAPFAEIRLTVCNREVHFNEPETGKPRRVLSGQYTLLPMIEIIKDVQSSAAELMKREASQYGKIERHRNVSHNAQVIAGTRVPVRAIRHFLEDGYSTTKILEQYPSITEADVKAVAHSAGIKNAA